MDREAAKSYGKFGDDFWNENDQTKKENEGKVIQKDYAAIALIGEWISQAAKIIEQQWIVKEKIDELEEKTKKQAVLKVEIIQLKSSMAEANYKYNEMLEDKKITESLVENV